MLPEQMQEPEPGVRDSLVVHVCRDQSSVFVWDFEGRERWTEGQQQQPEHTTHTGGAVCSTSTFVQWSSSLSATFFVFSTVSVTASLRAEFWVYPNGQMWLVGLDVELFYSQDVC